MRGLAFWLLPQVSWISDRELRRLAAALAITGTATARDYDKPLPSYEVASRAADIPSDGNEVPVVLSPTIDPGYLALHEQLDGRPFCVVLADPAQVVLADVQEGAGHESDETLADAPADLWLPWGDDGGEIALEVDDPVQGDRVLIDLGDGGDPVVQSNRVTRAWFADPATVEPGTRLDVAGLCTTPRALRPGGYAITRDASGRVHQLGAGPPAYKRSVAFRHGRRLAQAHAHAMRIRAAHDTSPLFVSGRLVGKGYGR